jgi:hypothetical protein
MVTVTRDKKLAESSNSQRTTSQRITSQQLQAMRAVKKASPLDLVVRSANFIWSSITESVGWIFSARQKKKSFCELNGHSLRMVNGVVTNRCRFCETEISSIEMLKSHR